MVKGLAGQAGADEALEVGSVPDVLVGAAQGVVDRVVGSSGFGDLLVELDQLAPSEPLPLVRRDAT